MHYGFVPNQPNLHSRFAGYTTNPFTFQIYVDMMAKFHIDNELSNDGYADKEQCMSNMKNIMEFNGIDPSGVFFGRNNLFTVAGKGVVPKVIAITDIIFEQFTEVYYNETEIYKFFSDLYRLCSKMSVEYLYKYIKNNSDTEIFMNILKRIHEIWEMNKINGVPRDAVYGPDGLFSFNEEGNFRIWDVIDQVSQLELYIASEIVRNNLLINTDEIYGKYQYDFDIR